MTAKKAYQFLVSGRIKGRGGREVWFRFVLGWDRSSISQLMGYFLLPTIIVFFSIQQDRASAPDVPQH